MGKGGNVAALTSESIIFSDISSLGSISRTGRISQDNSKGKAGEAIVAINPGGEEMWARLQSKFGSPGKPFVVLNNAYSTSYDIGNKKGYEEVYYLKRISKGWIYRAYPGKWEAYLEKPDGNTELVESYKNKPLLREVSNMVRELSFKRYAIGNDRWSKGFGERL
uniref:DUF1995 domain-containing protein n=2 Tax=Corethron hystrix TaxID=216773 RepID=A0A7S1C2I0_9STRA|mmetsp:Transcript_9595/g.21307  ORF Transcript_9595/g.21307 Transcript_9595/m.21307 type:complete len:165 (+) Transcript_9595:363-857(+)